MKGIEFVCLGNNARSVMAEVIAKDYARKIGADIPIYSSGVGVKAAFETGLLPNTLEAAKLVGIDLDGLSCEDATRKIWSIEGNFRDQALIKRGYSPVENHTQKQTEPKENVLMLAVSDSVKKRLLEQHPTLPYAYTIAEYANADMSSADLQTWLTDVNALIDYLDKLIRAVPNTIDKYICEFNK